MWNSQPTKTLWVNPDSVITLGGPITNSETCHAKHHNGELDLLGKLTLEEQLQAVKDSGGIENARVKLEPSDYAPEIQQARRQAIMERAA